MKPSPRGAEDELSAPLPQARRRRALLIVTPFCAPNYAYPAPAYLARYLRRQGYEVAQADLSLETLLCLFSRPGLELVFSACEAVAHQLGPDEQRLLNMKERYLATIDLVIRYLQGRDPSIAYRLYHPMFLPRGKNFELHRGFDWFDGAGNTLAVQDRAKFVATQYLYDLAALIREAIFPYFQITFQDRLYDAFVHLCVSFEPMRAELERAPNVVDWMLHYALDAHLKSFQPDVVGVTVPFARNLYWALRIGRYAKQWNSDIKVVAGGGLFNTSMRAPNEPRLFDYIDFLTLDDGERPLLNIMEHLDGTRGITDLKRTFYRAEDGAIRYSDGGVEPDAAHEEAGAPDYQGYRIWDYFTVVESVNATQRLQYDGWWNKLTMAHGCYWKKCTFCDIHLSYVRDYETASAQNLVDKVEECIAQTGHTSFHFVDEAMPPKIMREFALEVLRRNLRISWNGMLRFDRTFTPDLCKLLATAGLVAVFGGLEVASDRLLRLMKKGTTVEQVTRVAKNFQDAGIRAHAYIMYGFPSQTAQETIDALDVVRQLFKHGLVTSVSLSKMGVTPHSPIGRNPGEYGIKLLPGPKDAFVEQIILHTDPANDHERFTDGLERAVNAYGLGFHHDTPAEAWFDFPVPAVSIDRELIAQALAKRELELADAKQDNRPDRAILWLGVTPTLRLPPAQLGQEAQAEMIFHDPHGDQAVMAPTRWACWLLAMLVRAQPNVEGPLTLRELETSWNDYLSAWPATTPAEQRARAFSEFLTSDVRAALPAHGLLFLDGGLRSERALAYMPPPQIQLRR